MHFLRPLIFLIGFFQNCGCAKILCIASVPTFSHNMYFRSIWKELSKKGHQLTVLTANPMDFPYPNITEIDLNFVYERKSRIPSLSWKAYNWPSIILTYEKMFAEVAESELNHPEVQTLLKNKTEYFDLVIAEMHIPLMFGFAHRFRCPLIGISSSDITTMHHSVLGNPAHPILYPETFMPFGERTFSNRFLAGLYTFYKYISYIFTQSSQHEVLKKYFGSDVPSLEDLTKMATFVLLNIHPMFNSRPLGPKFVTIGGGTHLQKPRDLPKDIQELLDDSTQEVVYFSLGTNIKLQQYPSNLVNASVEAFRELSYTILWKFEYHIPNVPKNVHIFKWVPQQDVLRHKNIKAFITQGGIHSMEEALYAKVPMVGIPFMSDQNTNIQKIVDKGCGTLLDKDTLTKTTLKEAIIDVITNPRYKKSIVKISNILQDQPINGVEKAIWYIEYVLRHNNLNFILNNSNLDLPLYQYLLLDVISVTLLVIVALVALIYIVISIIICILKKLLRITKSKIE